MWLSSLFTAFAGSVYINEVRVEPSDLAGLELRSVNVRADSAGNLFIDAPGYTVSPVDPGAPAVPAPGPVGSGPHATTAPVPGVVPPPVATVPAGTWWLYVDDEKSSGHSIDVRINGTLVTTVRSGLAEPIILDVGKWLRPGSNQVECRAISQAPTGGPLYVYLGRGSDSNGTVDMGTPEVQFGVGRSRNGETSRSFTLEVR